MRDQTDQTDPHDPHDPIDPIDPTREDFVTVTTAAKARAEAVLKELQAASAECDSQLQKQSRTDLIRLVTGRSSLDAAIANTKRMIEAFERAVQDAKRAVENAGKTGLASGGNTAGTPAGRTDPAVWVVPTRIRAGLA